MFKAIMVEHTKNEFTQDLKTVLDLCSRVDERVKSIIENQQEFSKRMNRYVDEHNSLSIRVSLLESQSGQKMVDEINLLRSTIHNHINQTKSDSKDIENRIEKLESSTSSMSETVKKYSGLVLQAIFAILVAWLIWKLGLKS